MFYNILSEDGRVTNLRSLVKAYASYTYASGKHYTICRGILLVICISKISKNIMAIQKYAKGGSVREWCIWVQWRTQEFCWGGFQQIQLRTEDRENGDLGAVAPSQEFWRQLQFGTRNFISYSKSFLIFDTLSLFTMKTYLVVFVKVKQLRTGGNFRILLPFFPNILGCWRHKFRNF